LNCVLTKAESNELIGRLQGAPDIGVAIGWQVLKRGAMCICQIKEMAKLLFQRRAVRQRTIQKPP
jgi:hypothetical protein